MASASWVSSSCYPLNNFGSATFYMSLCGINDGEDQAHSQTRVPAGRFSSLYCNCHSVTGTITITSNKNNAAGNQTVSITTAGIFSDSTNHDDVANGDKFCSEVVGGTFTEIAAVGYLFDTSFNSGVSKATNWLGQGSTSSGNNAGSYYQGFAFGGTEVQAQVKHYSAGSLSNLQVWETNGFQTLVSRINGVTGNQSVISAAGSWADDNTHTDSTSAGDLLCMFYGASSTERTYGEAMRFTSNDGGYERFAQTLNGGNINVTSYTNLSYGGNATSVETDQQEPAPYQCKFTEHSVYIYAGGGTGTTHVRKNGASVNGTVSWSTTIGWYIDSVNSDTFNAGDKAALQMVPNSASNLGNIGVHVAPGVSTETASVSLAIAKMNFNISASDPSFTRSVNLAIAKMNFAVSVIRQETGAVNLAIAKMNFTITASRKETVSVSLAIANPQIAAFMIDLSALNKLRQFNTFG